MNKQEVMKLLNSQSTVLSFPDRGPFGSSSYPGNWSGYIPMYFWNLLNAHSTAECFAGGGTTSDAAKWWKENMDSNFSYCGIDLNPQASAVRPDMVSMDIMDLNQELPDAFRTADVVLAHDPYPGINYIQYSGKAWKDINGNFSKRDIQNMSYEEGIKALNMAHGRLFSAMPTGSFMVIMVGEIRSKNVGGYKSMYKDLATYGELWQSFVKIQHNTKSGFLNKSYANSKRALTSQEMILVMKKPSGFEISIIIPKEYVVDQRDTNMSSWADLCMCFARSRKEFTNEDLYEAFRFHQKAKNNRNVEAKLRQTCGRLYSNGLLNHVGNGRWQLAA